MACDGTADGSQRPFQATPSEPVLRSPSLVLPAGTYVFADYCSGEVFTLQNGAVSLLFDTGFLIASFGEDEDGELYVVNRFGTIHRIVNVP